MQIVKNSSSGARDVTDEELGKPGIIVVYGLLLLSGAIFGLAGGWLLWAAK